LGTLNGQNGTVKYLPGVIGLKLFVVLFTEENQFIETPLGEVKRSMVWWNFQLSSRKWGGRGGASNLFLPALSGQYRNMGNQVVLLPVINLISRFHTLEKWNKGTSSILSTLAISNSAHKHLNEVYDN